RNLQGTIPPFRDNYQTSLFASCLAALDYVRTEEWQRAQPTLFEIGRTHAIDITPYAKTEKRAAQPDATDVVSPSIHPVRAALGAAKWWKKVIGWPVAVGLTGVLLVFASRAMWRLTFGRGRTVQGSRTPTKAETKIRELEVAQVRWVWGFVSAYAVLLGLLMW